VRWRPNAGSETAVQQWQAGSAASKAEAEKEKNRNNQQNRSKRKKFNARQAVAAGSNNRW